MRIKVTAFAMTLAAAGTLSSAQEIAPSCPEWALQPCAVGPQQDSREHREHREHRERNRVWDPNLAQWRVEHPRRVWDPNLAQYRHESRDEVWDPYLAQYRPRDARKDPPPPERERGRRSESRRRR